MRRISLFRSLVWGIALASVLFPELLQQAALRLRIGRGADFLLYLLALCFPVAGFYLLHAIEKQRHQITQLVRVLAHREPLHGPGMNRPGMKSASVQADTESQVQSAD